MWPWLEECGGWWHFSVVFFSSIHNNSGVVGGCWRGMHFFMSHKSDIFCSLKLFYFLGESFSPDIEFSPFCFLIILLGDFSLLCMRTFSLHFSSPSRIVHADFVVSHYMFQCIRKRKEYSPFLFIDWIEWRISTSSGSKLITCTVHYTTTYQPLLLMQTKNVKDFGTFSCVGFIFLVGSYDALSVRTFELFP